MSRLNREDHFDGRVRYAAAVIANAREDRRAFDNCFENGDGKVVSAAIYRRSLRNPKIAENMKRYLDPAMAKANYEEYLGQNLKEAARALRLARGMSA